VIRFKLVSVLILVSILALTAGCAKTVTAPVPGQLNTYDAWAFRVLADTQAALNAFRSDISSGKVTETPTIRSAFNQATADYNVAEAAYQAWHAAGGTGSTATLSVQISTVQSDIPNLIGGAK
jgi:hypothetical protein